MVHKRPSYIPAYTDTAYQEWLVDVMQAEKMLKTVGQREDFAKRAAESCRNAGVEFDEELFSGVIKHVYTHQGEHSITQGEADKVGKVMGAIMKKKYPLSGANAESMMTELFPDSYKLSKKFKAQAKAMAFHHSYMEGKKDNLAQLWATTSNDELKDVVSAIADLKEHAAMESTRIKLDATRELFEIAAHREPPADDPASGTSTHKLTMLVKKADLSAKLEGKDLLATATGSESYLLAAKIRDGLKPKAPAV